MAFSHMTSSELSNGSECEQWFPGFAGGFARVFAHDERVANTRRCAGCVASCHAAA